MSDPSYGVASNSRACTRVITWNVEWATPRSARGSRILEIIEARRPDLACLTESQLDLVPTGGHVISSTADYGYPGPSERRKVVLWSRHAWTDVDVEGDPTLPSGRFVRATTETPIGPIEVVGVCIP